MDSLDERFLIYTALIVLCAFASVFLGVVAGIWSFIQMMVVIEGVYLIGGYAAERAANSQ